MSASLCAATCGQCNQQPFQIGAKNDTDNKPKEKREIDSMEYPFPIDAKENTKNKLESKQMKNLYSYSVDGKNDQSPIRVTLAAPNNPMNHQENERHMPKDKNGQKQQK
jgi:hypothetical protein